MARAQKHKWIFQARFRAHAFGWKSQPAITRVREAVSEIKKVARKDPILGAEGAVLFLQRVSAALERIDSSSGSMGTAVNNALHALVPIICEAPADDATRDEWLARLWQAYLDDEMPYIEALAEFWGDLCVTPRRASQWADDLAPFVRASWSRGNGYYNGTPACLSCLLAAGRHDELLALIEHAPYIWWFYRQYGVRALAALGRVDEAIEYAHASLGLNDNEAALARLCEEVLLAAGRVDEAYERYAIAGNQASSYLATFRAIARKYPEKEKHQVLTDLIASTPGEEGKWFATAKHLKLHDLAVKLAKESPCEPATLNRAARDHLETHPAFARAVALASLRWLTEGWGYEITSADVHAAHDYAMRAAEALGRQAETRAAIIEIISGSGSSDNFVLQVLGSLLGLR